MRRNIAAQLKMRRNIAAAHVKCVMVNNCMNKILYQKPHGNIASLVIGFTLESVNGMIVFW
jgi:hypothetical protein